MERAYTQSMGCATCPPGYNCQEGTSDFSLYPCPKGGYCAEGTRVTNCPSGTYNDYLYGRSLGDCKTCPSGHQCDEMTPDRGEPCDEGYYCPRGSGYHTHPCPAGTHGANRRGKKDVSECLPCPPGHYCPEASATATAVDPGYYNKFSGMPSLAAVYKCPPGYYCPNSGMTSYEGFYCNAGYVCPGGSSSATATPCPEGTFSDTRGLHDVTHCDLCPKGFYCPEGSTSAEVTDCPENYYCPPGTRSEISANDGTILPCPAGTYSPYLNSHSVEDCLPCPPGSYCLAGAGASTCDDGYYCPEGTTVANQYPCPAGFYGAGTGLFSAT
jgi:hypothetical protein